MTWPHDDNDFDQESPEEPEGERRIASIVVSAFVLAVIGSASAFAWRAYGGTPYPFFSQGSGFASSVPKTVGFDEFQTFQQQIAGQIQSNAQALAAQQAELKRLSEQMAVVSGKMDAIQSSIASARAALPAAPPKPTKAAAAKPKAHISTGGTPLPPPVQLTH